MGQPTIDDTFRSELSGLDLEVYDAFGKCLREWYESRLECPDPPGVVFAQSIETTLRIFVTIMTSYVDLSIREKDLDPVKDSIISLFAKQMDCCLRPGDVFPEELIRRMNVH